MSLRRHCLAAVLPLLCACAPQPKGVPPADTSTRRVATDVYFIRGRFVAGEQPDGNSVLLRGRTGWVVVDTGRHPAHAAAIEAFVQGSGAPLVAVVNTHWHLDHVGGNLPLRAAYPQVQVHASRQVTVERNGFLARYRTQLETLLRERVDDPQAPAWREEVARIDGARAFEPTHPVEADGMRTLDGRALRLGLRRDAVSGGDVWLFDPRARVLVAGDLVTLPVPLLDTACPGAWVEGLASLEGVPFDVLVPGHGEPMGRADFQRYRAAFGRLLACAAGPDSDAACTDAWLADVGDLVPVAQHAHARQLLQDYYLPQRLRGRPERPPYCPR
jgi:glyoxylase-like metal-dependent hydrolase (beta-lactamase superfamily II)